MLTFKLEKNPAVWWPVTVNVPVDGGYAQCQFEALIRVLPESVFQEKLTLTVEQVQQLSMTEFQALSAKHLPEFVKDWRGIADDVGDVPITRLPELMTGSPYSRPLFDGLWRAIGEVRFGRAPEFKSATEKNSEPSPAPGQATAADATN